MELKRFNYTKGNGETTYRELVVISKPNPNFYGVDVTEMAPGNFTEFAERYNALQTQYQVEMDKLLNDFDLKYNRKAFKPEGITEAASDWV